MNEIRQRIKEYKEQWSHLNRQSQQYLATVTIVISILGIITFFFIFPSIFMILMMVSLVGAIIIGFVWIVYQFVKDFIVRDD